MAKGGPAHPEQGRRVERGVARCTTMSHTSSLKACECPAETGTKAHAPRSDLTDRTPTDNSEVGLQLLMQPPRHRLPVRPVPRVQLPDLHRSIHVLSPTNLYAQSATHYFLISLQIGKHLLPWGAPWRGAVNSHFLLSEIQRHDYSWVGRLKPCIASGVTPPPSGLARISWIVLRVKLPECTPELRKLAVSSGGSPTQFPGQLAGCISARRRYLKLPTPFRHRLGQPHPTTPRHPAGSREP